MLLGDLTSFYNTSEAQTAVHNNIIIAVHIFLTGAARDAEVPAVPDKFHGVLINPHQTDGVHVGENATVEPTSSHLAEQNRLFSDHIHIYLIREETMNTVVANLSIHVGNAAVALSCSIELADLLHPKTLCEGFPHTGAQPIPDCQTNFVALLGWPDWLRQEVAADFADILHHLQAERKRIDSVLYNAVITAAEFKLKILQCSCT